MSESKPGPIEAPTIRKICPVCGKASYSQEGTHPQCALARADAALQAARKASGEIAPRRPAVQQWSRR